MATRTYHGSCHCGAVRFECELDLAAETTRCNCSICAKGRFWKSMVKASALRLLQGADALTDYQFGSDTIHHLFCRTCGIKPFGRANLDLEFRGERMQGEYYAVNVACLDDATPEQLAAVPVRYEDGRNDRWDREPPVTGHL
jgi:hypothetical protein